MKTQRYRHSDTFQDHCSFDKQERKRAPRKRRYLLITNKRVAVSILRINFIISTHRCVLRYRYFRRGRITVSILKLQRHVPTWRNADVQKWKDTSEDVDTLDECVSTLWQTPASLHLTDRPDETKMHLDASIPARCVTVSILQRIPAFAILTVAPETKTRGIPSAIVCNAISINLDVSGRLTGRSLEVNSRRRVRVLEGLLTQIVHDAGVPQRTGFQ